MRLFYIIQISSNYDCLSVVCQNCYDLVANVEKLVSNYSKVSKMFLELAKKSVFDNEVDAIRHKYDIFESIEHKNSETDDPLLPYVHHLKIEIADYSQTETESINVKSDSICIDGDYDDLEIKNNLEDEQQLLEIDCDEIVSYDNEVDESVSYSIEDVEILISNEENISSDQELHPVQEELNNQNVQEVSLRSPKKRSKKEKSVGNSETDKFVCTICQKSFISRRNLKKHENIHLPDHLKKVISCPICKKTFRLRKLLAEHVKAMHITERPYICEECGKSFIQRTHLIQHSVTHSSERPCSCPKCPKSFKNASHLQKHMDIHNEDIHQCPECGKQLTTKRNLRVHMIVHSDQKKYSCQLCERKFKRLHTLKVNIFETISKISLKFNLLFYFIQKHLVWHTGDRPFTCSFCDKTFTHGFRQSYHEKHYHSKEFALKESKVIA